MTIVRRMSQANRPGVAGRPKGSKNFVQRYRRSQDIDSDDDFDRNVRAKIDIPPKNVIASFQVVDTRGVVVAFPSHMRLVNKNDLSSNREWADWKLRTQEYLDRHAHIYPKYEYVEIDFPVTSIGTPTVVGGETYGYTREKISKKSHE
jgi:hypothetical protein